jgi:hypothetical protein
MMKTFRIFGRIVNIITRRGIKDLRIEAWDKDLVVKDLVGSAKTGEEGFFQIQFDELHFKKLFLDRQPDLFLKIFRGTRLIKSTEDFALWNVDRKDNEMIVEVQDVTPHLFPFGWPA